MRLAVGGEGLQSGGDCGGVAESGGEGGGEGSAVHGEDEAVETMGYLAGGGRVGGDDDGFAEHLGFAHGDGFAFEAGGLEVDVAGFDVGIGIHAFAKYFDMVGHVESFNVFAYKFFHAAIAYDIPFESPDSFFDKQPAYLGDAFEVFCLAETAYGEQIEGVFGKRDVFGLVGEFFYEGCVEDVFDDYRPGGKFGIYAVEYAFAIFRHIDYAVDLAEHAAVESGVGHNFVVVGVNPCHFHVGIDATDEYGGNAEKVDGEVVVSFHLREQGLHGAVDDLLGVPDAVGESAAARPAAFGELCPQSDGGFGPLPLTQQLRDGTLEEVEATVVRQEVDMPVDKRHEIARVRAEKQIDLIIVIIEGVEQAEKGSLGAAYLHGGMYDEDALHAFTSSAI